ncbi:MAG: hypothetical protein KDE01_02750, partial [Caldilineaceae bacterium]|nr:hypothetical protein [Caldilineaceae bacterium]
NRHPSDRDADDGDRCTGKQYHAVRHGIANRRNPGHTDDGSHRCVARRHGSFVAPGNGNADCGRIVKRDAGRYRHIGACCDSHGDGSRNGNVCVVRRDHSADGHQDRLANGN